MKKTARNSQKKHSQMRMNRLLLIISLLFGSYNIAYAIEQKSDNPSQIRESSQTSKITVSGKIVDENNDSLIGVTIKIAETNYATLSDENGNYSIANVPFDATLVFSYIGFKTQSIKVNNKKHIDVTLEEDSKLLNVVVVTALGIKREEKALGYAVQKLNGDAIKTVKGVDLATSLTGRIAGMMVKNSSNFADAPNISVRGETPLLVVDGVPYQNVSLRDIPNDDVETITVLKGAAASALYGERGGSGAIMITTKSGSKDLGLTISINSSSMFSAGYLAIPEAQSVFGREMEGNTNTYTRSTPGAWGPPMEGQMVKQWNPTSQQMEEMPYLPIGKNNFKNFLEQGYILNNNICLVQQGKFGSFRTSATWVDNKGTYPGQRYNKYTFNIGGDMKINKFSLRANFAYNKQSSPNLGFNGYRSYDPMYSILLLSTADFDIRQYKNYWIEKDVSQNNSYTNSHNNPYFDVKERIRTLDRDVVNGMFAADYDLASWLKGTARLGYDLYTDVQEVRISQGSYTSAGTTKVTGIGDEIWGESRLGSYNYGISRGYSINGEFIFNADKQFGDFNVNGLFGGSIFYNQYNAIDTQTRGGISVPGFYALKASVDPIKVKAGRNKSQTNSLFYRAGASWKSMIFVDGTVRNDWCSTLSADERSYLYPSVSGSFILSELLPKTNWLSLLKLRAGWTTSKKTPSIYEVNTAYNITQNAWGTSSSASLPTSIKDVTIRPETHETTEFGTNINLFENRISFDVAFFKKRRYNFITYAGVSPASGYYNKYINLDEEKTRKGTEITVNIMPVTTKDIDWNIQFNWSKSIDRFTKLDPVFSGKAVWIYEGARTDAYTSGSYFERSPDGEIVHNADGTPKYSNVESIRGYTDPDWIWGASSGLRYKNWHLNISMDGRVGGLVESFTTSYMWLNGVHPNSVTPERYLDATIGGANYLGKGVIITSGTATYDQFGNVVSDTREFAPNTTYVTYRNYIANSHKNFAWGGKASELDVFSATFLKIREISLTYDFPKNICQKIKAKQLSVSAIGQNVFMWAKDFKFSDPDGGYENLSDPSKRYLGFNVNVSF